MPLFTLIDQSTLHIAPNVKVVPASEFSKLVAALDIVTQTKREELDYRKQVTEECEVLKELAERAGFQAGLDIFNKKIEELEREITRVRHDMEKAIVSIALTAVRKIIGQEVSTNPEAIVGIVSTALKTVVHHRRVKIYVHPQDLENLEAHKPRLKALFEHLESLSLSSRDDIQQGGCVIETEGGIINAKLDNQLSALESAFHHFFHKRRTETT
jgi:type III secretion protein L